MPLGLIDLYGAKSQRLEAMRQVLEARRSPREQEAPVKLRTIDLFVATDIDPAMTRLGSNGSSRSQSHLIRSAVGSNVETLPVVAPANYSIVSDRSPKVNRKSLGKAPPRAASFVFPRGRSLDSSPVLPERAPEALQQQRKRSPHPAKKERYRASERGRGSLLPTASFDLDHAPLRPRTASTDGGLLWSTADHGMRRATSGSHPNAAGASLSPATATNADRHAPSMTQSLRNRRSTLQLQDDETTMTQHHYPVVQDIPASSPAVQRGVQFTWSDTFGKTDKPRNHHSQYDYYYQSWNSHAASLQWALKNVKRGQLFQAIVMLGVTCFVLDSYYKAMATTEHLLMVKHEESLMMLHLKRLEEQALHLHESVTRLSERGFDRLAEGGNGPGGSDPARSQNQHVDADLIKVQYDQLRQMEDELNHEVKSLQNKIRQTDRANIVRAFGEGPVQVALEIDFAAGASSGGAAGSSAISILLWYETPHAAWTLLDQIRRGVWDGAQFEMDRGFAVTANPTEPDSHNKRLEFMEKGQKMHEPWTVGLTETDDGELSLFINLQDNSQYHKHDVCVGKIIDGFDTLQRLTRAARNQQQSNVPVTIRRAAASHLTRRESAGLI